MPIIMRLRQFVSYCAIFAVIGCVVLTVARAQIPLATHMPSPPSNGASSYHPTPLPSMDAPPQLQDFVNRVIARTNMDRAQFHCPALKPNSILMGTAQYHSQDMALHDFVGHDSSDGATAWDRMYQAGYHYAIVEENVAWGQQTPEAAVDAWFNETPPNDLHRQNILNCQVVDIGVGYYYLADDPGQITAHTYWTEDFGRPLGSD